MAVSVESTVPRKKEDRVKETLSIASETLRMLNEYSKQSDIAKGRIVDRAVVAYLEGKLASPPSLNKQLESEE